VNLLVALLRRSLQLFQALLDQSVEIIAFLI